MSKLALVLGEVLEPIVVEELSVYYVEFQGIESIDDNVEETPAFIILKNFVGDLKSIKKRFSHIPIVSIGPVPNIHEFIHAGGKAIINQNFLQLDLMKEFQRKAKELQIELDKHDMQYRDVNATEYETRKNDYENKYKNMKKEYEKDKNMQYDAFFRFKYGNTLMALRDIKGAIEQYKAAIEQDPNLKDAYTNISVAYFLTGDCPNAVKYYKLAKEKKAKINRNFERDLKKRCGVK